MTTNQSQRTFRKKLIGILKKAVDVLPQNIILNNLIKSVDLADLKSIKNVKVDAVDIDSDDYRQWVNDFFPGWRQYYGELYHKKLIEFYSTHMILKPTPEDTFCDIAGGIDTYLPRLDCREKILQDISIAPDIKDKHRAKVVFIEGDAGQIPLPDDSLDKISSHHSFEHFQGESDILFIKEVQRLLRIGGLCCIIPIFIANRYVEVTNKIDLSKKFDAQSKTIVDPTATVPGAGVSGNYARIYDPGTLVQRVIDNIDLKRFSVMIHEIRLHNASVPDLTLACHKNISKINRPYRALVILRDR